MNVNEPPAYTVPPLTASAYTYPLAFGFQAATVPFASTWKTLLRVMLPTVVNDPPTYHPPRRPAPRTE